MLDCANILRNNAILLIHNEILSVKMYVEPIRSPNILWINERAIKYDPFYVALENDINRYRNHILSACAYLINDLGENLKIAWADRYGGAGIGHAGGSGRAININGYNVKGVGKTPLIGLKSEPGHSTGTISLEEAIREVIYSEIMSVFPWSTIPIYAIIDTGLIQMWDKADSWSGANFERRVLLVRPTVIRPAHFERSEGIMADEKDGAKDAKRVSYIINCAKGLCGSQNLKSMFVEFWCRWAEQMAFGLVRGITQHAHSVSNISIGGQLLDFGGARASLGSRHLELKPGIAPYDVGFQALVSSISRTKNNLAWYGDLFFNDVDDMSYIVDRYNSAIATSILSNVSNLFNGDLKQIDNFHNVLKVVIIKDSAVALNLKLWLSRQDNVMAAHILETSLRSATGNKEIKIYNPPNKRKLFSKNNIQILIHKTFSHDSIKKSYDGEDEIKSFIKDKVALLTP